MENIVIEGVCGIQKFFWELSKDTLSIRSRSSRSETIIPLSQIKSVSFTYAPIGGGGRIDVDIGSGPSGFVKLTSSVAISDSGREFLIFKKGSTKNAEHIRDYINSFLSDLTAYPAPQQSSSLASEIAQLKKLLDEGVITQPEFDSAKQKLLK